MSTASELTIDQSKCIRCGACASLEPRVFQWRDGMYALVRQPSSTAERQLAEAALLACPSSAIGVARS
jgi:ferredoxin